METLLGLIAYLAAALAVLAMAGLTARAWLVLAHAYTLRDREVDCLREAQNALRDLHV